MIACTAATRRTENFPFAAGLIVRHVNGIELCREVDLGSVVRPRTELHRALLVVEREPLDVDGAGGDEETERNPRHLAAAVDDRVGGKLAVNVLVGTVSRTHTHTHTHTRARARGGYSVRIWGLRQWRVASYAVPNTGWAKKVYIFQFNISME